MAQDINRRINIYVNGQQVENTFKGVKSAMRKARYELSNMTIGSEEYVKQTKKIARLQGILDKHRQAQGRIATGWKKSKNNFMDMLKAFTGGQLIVNMLNKIASSIPRLVGSLGKMDDELADVGKTTGLTAEEVDYLNGRIMEINTRTSNSELRKLASTAGKLGKDSVNDVLGFVKAADKINVALSEDLGKGAIKQLGKLSQLFGTEEEFGTEKGLLKLGSAINAIGANSSANEKFITEFSKEFGNLAENAEIAETDVIGLAGAIDALGIKKEVATSTLTDIIKKMGEKEGIAKFAEVAGVSVKEFANLLENDANEALMKVLAGAKSTSGGINGLVETLDNLGVTSDRASKVLPGLANNIDFVRKQQALASEEFKKGTSIVDEFNRKNNSLAGNLQKIGKNIKETWLNSGVKNAIDGMVQSIADWMEKPVSEKLRNEKMEMNRLVSSIIATKDNRKLQNKYIDKLNELYPSLLENMDSENLNYDKLKENLREMNSLYKERIRLKVMEEEGSEIMAKGQSMLREQRDIMNFLQKTYKEYPGVSVSAGEKRTPENIKEAFKRSSELGHIPSGLYSGVASKAEEYYELTEKINENEKEYKELMEEINKQVEKLNNTKKEQSESPYPYGIQQMGDSGEYVNISEKPTGDTDGGDGGDGGDGEEGDKNTAYDNALQKLNKIQEQYVNERREIFLQELSDQKREMEKRRGYWNEQIKVVNSAIRDIKDKEGELTEADKKLLEALRNQQTQIIKARERDINAIQEKYAEKRKQKKQEVLKEMEMMALSSKERQKRIEAQKYKDMLKMAEKYGLESTELYAKIQEKLRKIQKGGDGDEGGEDKGGGSSLQSFLNSDEINNAVNIANEISGIYSSMTDSIISDNERRLRSMRSTTQQEKEHLKKQLDQQLISRAQYNNRVASMEQSLNQKEKDLRAKRAQDEKQAKIFEARMNELAGLVRIWSSHDPAMAAILSGLMLAKTEIQISKMKSQKVPAYASGGYVEQPQLIEAGEAGKELVLSNKVLRHPVMGEIADNLARWQAGEPIKQGQQTQNVQTETRVIEKQTGTSEVKRMREEIQGMREDIKNLKNIRAIISRNEMDEADEEEEIRKRYTNL